MEGEKGVSLPFGWWVGAGEAGLNLSLALVVHMDNKRRKDGLWVEQALVELTVANPGSAGATVTWGFAVLVPWMGGYRVPLQKTNRSTA